MTPLAQIDENKPFKNKARVSTANPTTSKSQKRMANRTTRQATSDYDETCFSASSKRNNKSLHHRRAFLRSSKDLERPSVADNVSQVTSNTGL